jgi:hypothetical protein
MGKMMSKRIKYTDAVPNSIVTRYKEDNTQYLLDQVARLTAENAMLKEKWLAQPEQEPVAWCQMAEGNVQDLLTSFEMKDWLYDKSWIPLYTAPPKREQLSDGELEVWYSQHAWAMDKQEYMWGFRDAEKAHGIGGE